MNLATHDKAVPSTNSIGDKQPEKGDFRSGWHRPSVAIIDIKRTMATPGIYEDGGSGSQF